MKIIHCADIHLDSRLLANLDERKARARREEILHTFLRMIDFAAEHQVKVILIAGDLFDTKRVSAGVRNSVEAAVRKHSDIAFYMLKGNHDASGFLDALQSVPENLHLFSGEWTSCVLNPESGGNIVLTGAELDAQNGSTIYSSLVLDYDKFNIVMLHGQQNQYTSRNQAENIALGQLAGKGIDYLALGHVHGYHAEALDKRGVWCYSGCLEGRGFDECGEHGFVLLDIDEETKEFTYRMIPFASRHLYTVEADVTGAATSSEMADLVEARLEQEGLGERDMVKVVLAGELDVSCEKNLDFMVRKLEDRFFFLKIYDETRLTVDYNTFLLDESLKGEFVRLVKASEELDEMTRLTVIRYGLQALAGEEIK